MIARIDEARSNGDTIGGVFEVVVHGLPIGLGSYVHWDRRLDAALAAAVMSINIVKGVEFGLGFEQTRRFGSAVHDVIEGRGEGGRWVHRSNNAGGLTGGVTNGEPLVVRGAVKPISTLARPLPSADLIYRRGRREGPLRAQRHQRRPGRRRRRRGDGDAHPGRRSCSRSSAATRWTTSARPRPLSRAHRRTTRDAGRRGRAATRPGRHRRGRLGRGRLIVDVVLVGLPGSGKSAVGRRLAQRHDVRVHRPRRADRDARRAAHPGDLRGGGRGRLPRARASGHPRPWCARPVVRASRAWSPPAAGPSSIHATAGPSTAGGSRSGSTDGRRSSPSGSAAAPTCGR